MTYLQHLHANMLVAKKALIESFRQLILALFHLIHGIFPCKFTDHHWYNI